MLARPAPGIFSGLVLGMASLFMMLELDNPFSGLITVSDAPLRNALMYLGQ
jgi:hypothetical protein